jgi:hypothetical protein
MTPAITSNFHGAKLALAQDYGTFCVLAVSGNTIDVKFFFQGADLHDVQSIADAFNAVLSPKAKDATDAE